MFHSGQDLALGGAIAGPLVGDDDPWHIATPLQQFAEEALGRMLVALGSDQNIQNVAVLIHGPPEISQLAVDLEENFIKVPLVPRLRTAVSQLVGVGLAELKRPLTQGFIGHVYAAGGEEFFDIAIAQRETEIEPHGVGDDFGG